MPYKASRPCRKSGCNGKTTEKHGYCEKHAHLAGWGEWQSQRGNRHKRQYGTAWQKLRAVVLERDSHLCQQCLKESLYTQATHVDHLKPRKQGGTDDLSNLQSLCKPCHEKKTAKERYI